MCASEQTLLGGRTPWSKYMRTTPPTTNIYFMVKPCASARKPWVTAVANTPKYSGVLNSANRKQVQSSTNRLNAYINSIHQHLFHCWKPCAGCGKKYTPEYIARHQFVCIIKCKQKVGEKNHEHHVPNNCVQQHHHLQHLFILVCLQQYHLRVPSSLQQSATIYLALTKYIHT